MRQLLFLFLLFSAVYCRAQEFSGKVIDEMGNPIEGVAITVKGSTSGVASNSRGEFRIRLAKLPTTLVFSAVNFKAYQTTITAKTGLSFQVVLLRDRSTIDEVVVTAMGASRETSYPDYYAFPVEGKVSGLKVEAEASKTKPIVLRGFASVAGTFNAKKTYYRTDTTSDREVTDVRAGLLTAGEISDFKKWKMWEDFNETEFKRFSEHWKMSPLKRYTVQLQNNDHKALVGVKVYLIDQKTNDTVWRAVSDNTGKAELWGGMGNKQGSVYMIGVEGQKDLSRASEFANGINIIRADKNCTVSDKVQISFVVDATGSMGDEIEFLKEELEDIITKTMEKNESLDLAMSSVFYRDKTDEYLTRKIDFEEDILKVANFIKMQHAGGGGDYPEAVNDALRTAIYELKWDAAARARILFIVLDAPPHDEAKAEMLLLMEQAAAKGIRVVPIACSGTDKSTEFLMRSMALATNGTYLFLTDHSGIGSSHIEPTTDSYSVESLNALLQRTIEQMIYTADCNSAPSKQKEPVDPRYENVLKLKLYPNPTQGKVTIETDKDIKELYVADFSGKLLKRIEVAGKKRFEVDLTAYPSATYFIRYITADGKQGAEKVILIH